MRRIALSFLLLVSSAHSQPLPAVFSIGERQAILAHGPWPPPAHRDPSNRVSGKREAIALGERLFFEPRLSGTGSVLCATCHVPFRGFQDARPRGFGLEDGDRNTPTLFNVARNRWFGWDGGNDSLWAQSLRPLLDPREMRSSASHVGKFIRDLAAKDYELAFGRKPPSDDDELLADVGKALAAYQETLVTRRTPFDDFRDALERNAATDYPLAAQRGLRIFVGKGNCSVCHAGPQFTNGEFADGGVRFFAGKGRVDSGRYEGIRKVKASPYNLLGRFSDDASRASATGTRHVDVQHRNFGEFRVPSLRNVALTAPYMHDGSVSSLRDAVKHNGGKIPRELDLTDEEIDDVVAFLQTLTASERR